MYVYIYIFLPLPARPAGATQRGASVAAHIQIPTRRAHRLARGHAPRPRLPRALRAGHARHRCVGLNTICVYVEAVVHESTILSFPAHLHCLTLVQYYCTIIGQYKTPLPTSRLYVIHHTISVITITCKGQVGLYTILLLPTSYVEWQHRGGG